MSGGGEKRSGGEPAGEEALRARIAQLERINDALIKRVEESICDAGNAYTIFEQNIAMQKQIRARTSELAEANSSLKEEIRERWLAEEAMRLARDQAEAANDAKSQFLANMSHEIRTPMTAILGFLDILEPSSEITLTPEQRTEAFHTIKMNAKHLLRIIDEVLDVSKIEANRMQFEMTDADPLLVVEEVAKLIRPHASEKGVDIIVSYETTIPEMIRTDTTRLRQVLHNLVGNAVKFTEKGSVTIRIWCAPEHEMMTFGVEDTGIGMSPDQLKIVRRFEAFNQADTSMTRRFGGTGLGLKISHSIIECLGGELTVDSELGRGSLFTASVWTGPLRDARFREPGQIAPMLEKKAEEGAGENEPGALEGRSVLLVEDGLDNQRLITFLLRRAGARVTVADHGQIALDILEASADSPPELVLMDMQMPVLDGYAATRELRRRGFDLPILALTAHAMSGDREKCLGAGCNGYLTKPIDRAVLIEQCAAMIRGDLPGELAG